MNCCACAGSCNHVGPHSFCAAHGGVPSLGVITATSSLATTAIETPPPRRWSEFGRGPWMALVIANVWSATGHLLLGLVWIVLSVVLYLVDLRGADRA